MRERLTFHFKLRTRRVNFRFFFLFFFSFFLFFQIKARSRLVTIVNKHCDDFRLAELSADDFKCLIFAQGLVSAKKFGDKTESTVKVRK